MVNMALDSNIQIEDVNIVFARVFTIEARNDLALPLLINILN
jgi:hypothetical protein